MNKIIAYFAHHHQNESYIVRTKAKALASLTFLGVVIVLLKMLINVVTLGYSTGVFANYGSPGIVLSVCLANLYVLRKYSYKTSGAFFSSGLLIALVIGITVAANTVHPLSTYVNGIYYILAVFTIGALFGSRKSLIANAVLALGCVSYLYMSSAQLYEGDVATLAKGGFINFIIAIVVMTLVLYFTMKIAENAQERTDGMARKTAEQNEEIKVHLEELQQQKANLQATIADTNFVISEAVDSGNFQARIDLDNKEGEWMALGESINRLFEAVAVPFNAVNRIVNQMAQGDLTGRYEAEAKGDVLELKQNLNEALENLSGLLKEIAESVTFIGNSSGEMKDTSQNMANLTGEITAAIQEMSQGAQDQVMKADESSALIEAVSSTSTDIGQQATSINAGSKEGVKKGVNGVHQVESVTSSMQDILMYSSATSESIESLSKRSEQISRVLNIIQEIASQTNLLALNAAIEAAQAGDAGRGFAVVAEEIRKLAEDSKNSTKEIENLINDVQKDTTQTATLIGQMSESIKNGEKASLESSSAFEEITQSYKQTLDLSQKIVEDTNHQSSAMKNIVSMVEGVVVIAEETAAGTEQVASSSTELSNGMSNYFNKTQRVAEIVQELQRKMDRFKLESSKIELSEVEVMPGTN